MFLRNCCVVFMLYSFVGKGLSSLSVFFSKCNNSSLGADNTNINFLGVFSILNSFNVLFKWTGYRWQKVSKTDACWPPSPPVGSVATIWPEKYKPRTRGGQKWAWPGIYGSIPGIFRSINGYICRFRWNHDNLNFNPIYPGGNRFDPLHIFAYNIFCNFSAEYTTFDPIEMYRKTLCFYLIFITNWVE